MLFWDTKLENIDWQKHKRSVIRRLFERGNHEQIEEIIRFYGRDVVAAELKEIGSSWYPQFDVNVKTFFEE